MRAVVAQVKSSLSDGETISIFLSTLSKPYFNHVIGQTTTDFVTLIMIGERIEDCLESEKLTNIKPLQTMVKNNSGITRRKPLEERLKEEEKVR